MMLWALFCGVALAGAAEKGVSYSKDAAPVIAAKCLGCHAAPDGPAPMTSYEKVRGWAPMIKETLLKGRMPPWSADPRYGKFTDDMSLSPEELRALLGWIDAGAPKDGEKDLLAEYRPPSRMEWPLGAPDRVLAMARFQVVPATGTLTYQYFLLSGPLKEDLWIKAAQIRPGNERVVHHAILEDFPRPLESYQRKWSSGGMDAIRYPDIKPVWSWAPGKKPHSLPPGVAVRVRAGHSLVLEIHYNTDGKEETDKTEVGLYLHSGPRPPKELKTTYWERRDFVIEPGERYRVRPNRPAFHFERDAYIVNFRPHMHSRGVQIGALAEYPDGRRERLLNVKKYDFNWQFTYTYVEPKFVPAGTTVYAFGTFDNSRLNPANPDPAKTVSWGLGTPDEMFFFSVGYFDAAP